jgi:YD repeat-containing protein
MRRFVVSLSVVVVLLLGLLAITTGTNTRAQEVTPDTTAMMAMATHPVVGTWELTGELPDFTFPILATFHADGTYQEVYPWGAIFIGAWQPTGVHTAEGIIVGYEYVDDRLLRGEGRWTAEVDATGNAIHTDGPFVARYVDDDSIDLAVEGPSDGTRLEILPVVSLAELVPLGTPVLPSDLTDEATPAP